MAPTRHWDTETASLHFAGSPYCLFYFFLISLVACFAVANPKVNYDGLFYTALTCGTTDALRMHQQAMAFEHHEALNLDGYRQDLERNPYHFAQQLPFYSVKPLYVALLTLFSSIGLGWRAGAFVSAISYWLLGWTTWRWLRAWYRVQLAAPLSLLLLLNPAVMRAVRCTTPDLLATATVIAGCYLVFQAQRTFVGCALLIVGIWVRPEVTIFTVFLLCALWIQRRLPFFEAASLVLLALASYAVIGHFSVPYSVLFSHTFRVRLANPGEATIVLTLSDYLQVLRSSVQSLLVESATLGFPVISCFLGFLILKKPAALSWLALVALLSAAILYLAFPAIEARYYFSQLTFIPAIALFIQLKCALDRSLVS